MTVESERKVYVMLKNERIESQFAKNDGREYAQGIRKT